MGLVYTRDHAGFLNEIESNAPRNGVNSVVTFQYQIMTACKLLK
jgi:hypothetical protein